MGTKTAVWALAMLALSGCALEPDPGPAGPRDAGAQMPADAAPATDAGRRCEVPTSGFGTRIGARFSPITLPSCGGQPAFDFYGDGFCEAEATVFVINTGWCRPSQEEADQLAAIADAYAPRGVRVVEVLAQNETGGLPDQPFCTRWITEHHLGAHNVEAIDPAGATNVYNPGGSVPAHVVVDRHGVIRARFDGIGHDPVTSAAALPDDVTRAVEAILAEP